jgi:hypothetical protein
MEKNSMTNWQHANHQRDMKQLRGKTILYVCVAAKNVTRWAFLNG